MEEIAFTAEKLQMLLVHAAYGRAMMAAHGMEMRLTVFLMCHAIENNYPIALDSIKKMTFGVLVREFVKKYKPSEYLEEELDNMVFFRNDLAHRISDTLTRAAAKDDWCDRVIRELTEIEGYFRETDELLNPYMERCHRITKTTYADLRRIAERIYPGMRRSRGVLIRPIPRREPTGRVGGSR